MEVQKIHCLRVNKAILLKTLKWLHKSLILFWQLSISEIQDFKWGTGGGGHISPLGRAPTSPLVLRHCCRAWWSTAVPSTHPCWVKRQKASFFFLRLKWKQASRIRLLFLLRTQLWFREFDLYCCTYFK